jgi:Transposase DNA-binding/Transposase DDE domain
MPRKQIEVPALSTEFSDADLGDVRLNRRLGLLAERLGERPGESFPKALDDAELEAAYRFFGNDSVSPEAILAPHFRQTARRAAKHGQVLVIHDTTQFEFPGNAKREGLGRLIHPGQGFFGHFSLVATADGARVPLGLAALETVFRLDEAIGTKNWTPAKSRGERARWLNCVDDAETLLGGKTSAIHVMDREADSYAIFAALIERQRSFVIRSFQDRVLADHDEARLRTAARSARATFRREVPLSPRPAKPGPQGKRHPARRLRVARLSFAATSVELPRPSDSRAIASASVPLNVIHVFEPKPPPGQPAVEWFLLTNLPVGTPEEIAFVVDCYRGRWTIEEFFKALKTGCQYERRQLESATSLLNALAIFAPVAWRLLLLRHLARGDDKSQAISALTPKQLEVLRAVSRRSLPRRPSAKEAMLAVASLGGHLKSNGDPGWLVLGRGLHDLLLLELGWRAREEAARSDQS